MVQRKVSKKPGIQADDHVKSEKLLANHKTSSFQQKEIKNKGGIDLKKKMKKSRSFKKMKGPIGQPGKPPLIVLPKNDLATPKKPSPVRETIPNYMKSTTSSDARKETGFLFSSKSPPAFSSDGKFSIRSKLLNSNSKASSDPGNRGVRTLSRISSLKLVKTLTKTPSFKQARISARKCSSMILSENLNVPRATCSSTMKDHKFPDYLTLSVVATETEGTSIMKVCPYTYCSLNGHHHDSLPPLKSFLSSRRRMLKAQRSIKIGCLSPRRPKPVQGTVNEIEGKQRGPDRQPPPFEEDDMIQEMDSGLFIEIDSQQREDFSQMKQTTENEDFPEEKQNRGVGEKLYPPNLDQDKTELELSNFLYELGEHSTPSIQSEEEFSEKYDMQWEAGDVHGEGLYPGGAKCIKINDMIDLENANISLDEATFIIDETVGANSKKSLPDEILQEPIYSDFEAGSGAEDDSEYTSSHQNMWSSNEMKCEDQWHIRVEVEEAIPAIEDGQNEESNYHKDDTISLNSEFSEKAFEEKSLTNIEKEASETDCLSGMELDATVVHDSPQMICLVIGDSHDAGTSIFGHPHDISEIMTEKLSKCIGTQTEKECVDQQDMNGNILDEVQKRSIGTQTEFEDYVQPGALIDSLCYANAQLGESQVASERKDSNSPITADEVNQWRFIVSNTAENNAHEEITDTCKIKKGTSRLIEGNNELTEFNPRAPNFLPAEPDPEAETVDLRHLTLDEKKNGEDWMVDHAIQQAVSKLAQARKRKVAVLVEAFETVSPSPEYEHRLRNSSIASPQARAIQDCC